MQFTRTIVSVAVAGVLAAMSAPTARADTITVCWDGSGDYLTIQEGIDAAVDGDEVVVCEGTYTGDGNRDLDFGNDLPEGQTRAITVRSTDPEDPEVVAATVIDCQGTQAEPHRGFKFHSGETADSVVAGLTVTNGYAPEEQIGSYNRSAGGAVFCADSSPTFASCTFSGNRAIDDGGGMCNERGSPKVSDCLFSNNQAYRGAGMKNHGSAPTVLNCTFLRNQAGAGAGVYNNKSNPTLIGCEFIQNTAGIGGIGGGGGIVNTNRLYGEAPCMVVNCVFLGNSADVGGATYNCCRAHMMFDNCTFVGNVADSMGGAIANGYSGVLTLTNCILWGNSAAQGPEIALPHRYYPAPELTISYSNVQGGQAAVYVDPNSTLNWGDGNIDADPLFVDPGHWDDNGTPGDPDDDVWVDGDYHLLPGSPCIDAGDNDAVPEAVITDLGGNPRFLDDPLTTDTGNGTPPVVDMGVYEFMRAFLDIRPGTCPNSLNRKSKGVLPVAILGTQYLDVSDIDLSSIVLTSEYVEGGITPEKVTIEDVGTPFLGEPCGCHHLGGDGLADLLVKFRAHDLVNDSELPGGESVILTVTGNLMNGTPFTASDCVKLVGR